MNPTPQDSAPAHVEPERSTGRVNGCACDRDRHPTPTWGEVISRKIGWSRALASAVLAVVGIAAAVGAYGGTVAHKGDITAAVAPIDARLVEVERAQIKAEARAEVNDKWTTDALKQIMQRLDVAPPPAPVVPSAPQQSTMAPMTLPPGAKSPDGDARVRPTYYRTTHTRGTR